MRITVTPIIEKEISRLYRRDGELKASILVREAAKKASPLHDVFEWDDEKAGHEFRLIQGRNLIRTVKVTKVGEDGTVSTVRAFVHVPSEENEEGSYVTEEKLMKHPDFYFRALAETRQKLAGAREALQQLERLGRQENKPENALAIIGLAEKGLSTAMEAIRKLEAA